MPAFERNGIKIVAHGSAMPPNANGSSNISSNRFALLIPVGWIPSPLPQVANKSLNFIVRLGGRDAFGHRKRNCHRQVPRVLPRLIRMPAKVSGSRTVFVSLSSVIRALGGAVPLGASQPVLAISGYAAFPIWQWTRKM